MLMAKMGRPIDENAKRKTLTIRIGQETYDKLIKYAADHGLTMTEVALRSLEEFLSKP